MNMFITYPNRKDFLVGLYNCCYVYFQIIFISCFPFLSHQLSSIGNINNCTISTAVTIYSSSNSLLTISFIWTSKLLIFLYLLSEIRDRRYFFMEMSLCNTFLSLSIRKM